ncbi:DUF6271 family protein [Streptomyces sp. NPDC048182]|uniref:DUF6271 family protein n=1 Tax=Streptomyces sp. NPDC048182 TaxID=3365507 RepID=UPI0037215B9D
MRRVCLTLPTDRPCAGTLVATAREAALGARRYGAEVHLLVLDSSAPPARAAHRAALRDLPSAPGVVVHHLDETAQRAFLAEVAVRAGVPAPERTVDRMLPDRVSYGACTNRAFLLAEALDCDSVHRRDSDSGYQERDGEPVLPLEHELAFLGRPAAEAAGRVTRRRLDPGRAHRPVALVGGSFVGELSVDVAEIRRRDPAVHRDLVGLSIPGTVPEIWRRTLVDEAFRGAGSTPFTDDLTTLTRAVPARVDMCNIALDRRVYGRVPLPPVTDTVGSDYFLLHLVRAAHLPSVLHNRHIVNHHTPERRTGAGLAAYQLRLARFLLAAPRLHAVYAALAEAGDALLDAEGAVRAPAVAALVREQAGPDPDGVADRLALIERCHRTLGGPYTAVADALAARRAELMAGPAAMMADFVDLIDDWGPLVRAAGEARWYTGSLLDGVRQSASANGPVSA